MRQGYDDLIWYYLSIWRRYSTRSGVKSTLVGNPWVIIVHDSPSCSVRHACLVQDGCWDWPQSSRPRPSARLRSSHPLSSFRKYPASSMSHHGGETHVGENYTCSSDFIRFLCPRHSKNGEGALSVTPVCACVRPFSKFGVRSITFERLHLFNSNLVCWYIISKHRSSSIWVTIHLFLTELWAFYKNIVQKLVSAQ